MALSTTDLTTVTPGGSVTAPAKPEKGRKRARVLTNRKAVVGLVVLGIYVLFAFIGPWVSPFDPSSRGHDLLVGPSSKHWFGTTHLGQDIFSQVIYGTRGVMLVGFVAGGVAVALSVIVGVTAGYIGGATDETLSALSNVFLVLPALPLIIIITSSVPDANDWLIALVIGFTSWAWGARIIRAQTLSLRRRDYVEAARATGEKAWRIMVFELMPNLSALIASGFVGTVIFAVMSEITLAFIGIGGQEDWNWGTILYWAQSQQALAQGAWWWFVPAGLAIAFLGTALALVNFGIDEIVNPRLRGSGSNRVRTKRGIAHMRIGFTPVIRDSDLPGHPDRPAAPIPAMASTISFGSKEGAR